MSVDGLILQHAPDSWAGETVKSCPNNSTLERLLSAELNRLEAEEVRGHVSGCGECQQVLDDLSDDPELKSWLNLSDYQGSDQVSRDRSELNLLLERLRTEHAPSGEPPTHSSGAKYGFLDPPSRPGDLGTIGRYHIEREVGFGGMGIVFRGHDAAAGQDGGSENPEAGTR